MQLSISDQMTRQQEIRNAFLDDVFMLAIPTNQLSARDAHFHNHLVQIE